MTQGIHDLPISKKPLAEQLHESRSSPLKRYWKKAPGNISFIRLIQYELMLMLLGDLAGALGYLLRKQFYRPLFRKMGSGVILGKGITLRHPGKISLGDQVAIDDYVFLDASGTEDACVTLGDQVIISRNCVVQGKGGSVTIGSKTDIGCNTFIGSPADGIEIGESVLIGGNCYIGGSRYFTDRLDIPIMEQGSYSRGPVVIREGAWLGAGVIVLDGVRIGKGCVVGAGAVVTKDLPDYAVATGVPARVVQIRQERVSV